MASSARYVSTTSNRARRCHYRRRKYDSLKISQGKYKTEAEIKARTAVRYGMPQTEAEKKISAALEAVAGEVGNGATLVSVAVAWALAKAPYVFPVIGGRSPAQLDDVIKASAASSPA